MKDLALTRCFEEQWMSRVGNWPTLEAVRHYLEDSIRVQRCEDLVRPDGSPFRMLAIYWNPDLDLIFKVDDVRGRAVTVINLENWQAEKIPRTEVRESRIEDRDREPKRRQEQGFFDNLAARVAEVKKRFGVLGRFGHLREEA